MKKFAVIAVLALCVLAFATVSFADDEAMKCPMMKGGSCMCPKCCMMMKSALSKKMVATEDGSVVVLAGNKLMKYDKNLELKKEVEIKCDAKEACEKICKDCPCCQQMMKGEAKTAPTQPKAEPVAKKAKK